MIVRALGHKWPQKDFTKEIDGKDVEFSWTPRCAACLQIVPKKSRPLSHIRPHTHEECQLLKLMKVNLSEARFPSVKEPEPPAVKEEGRSRCIFEQKVEVRLTELESTVAQLKERLDAFQQLHDRPPTTRVRKRSHTSAVDPDPGSSPNKDQRVKRRKRKSLATDIDPEEGEAEEQEMQL